MFKQKRIQNMIITGLVLLFATGLSPGCRNIVSDSFPIGLMTNLLLKPEAAVITTPQPWYTWIPGEEEAMQIAYQVIVASSEENIQKDKGDVWDLGKVDSENSASVVYEGLPLNKNSEYWWKVWIWDLEDCPSSYSKPQKFNAGVFSGVEREWPQ